MNEYRDFSDRLTFDFHQIESNKYSKITKSITTEFGLKPVGTKITSDDVIFQNFEKNTDIVGLEWDIWSGYIVNAKTTSAESLVREIANFLSTSFVS